MRSAFNLVRYDLGTDVTIHGLELDAYNEGMRGFTSGVRAVNLAKCDIVDVVHIDGDIHAVGNRGQNSLQHQSAVSFALLQHGKIPLSPPEREHGTIPLSPRLRETRYQKDNHSIAGLS
jgi:hypothetical protein